MPTIPEKAADFTVGYMNEVLAGHLDGAEVTACDARESGIPGQTAEIIQVELEFDRPTAVASRQIAKITSKNPQVLHEVVAAYGQYWRETSFYREFPDPGIAIPTCYHLDCSDDGLAFIILMADLAPAASPSWAISPEQVEQALSHLPAFHARWWRDPRLRELQWLVQYDNEPFYKAAFGAADAARTTIESHFGESAALAIEMAAVLNERGDAVLAYLATRNFTFVHGDYHAKQMFFPTDAGGEFSVIDWQFPFVAPGALDFARLSAMCLDSDAFSARLPALMRSYHGDLQAAGINDYSALEFEDDFRLGLIVSQMIMSIATADTDISILARECEDLGVAWQEAVLLRTQRALADWDALAFLKSL